MPDLFITYSRKNKEFVRRLVDALEKQGRDVWVDWEDIPPTVDWMKEIRDGIDSSNSYVYIITPDSINSKVCLAEIEHALDQQKKLIPVLHQDVEMPSSTKERRASDLANPLDRAYSALGFESDSDRILEYLSPHNWIFFREEDDFETAFATLSEALDDDQDYIREHTRLLVRAREWDDKARDSSFLLTDAAIKEAEQWLKDGEAKFPKPTDLHRAYINASRLVDLREQQYEMELQQRAARRLRYLAVALTVFLIAAIGLSIFAFNEQNRAQNAQSTSEANHALSEASRATSEANRAIAQAAQAVAERRAIEAESFVLAERARLVLENGDTLTSVRIALEAVNLDDPPPPAQAVLSRAAYIGPRANFSSHRRQVMQLEISPDGTQALSASLDGTARLWDIETVSNIHALRIGSREEIVTGAFSADGSRILAASDPGEIVVWDVETGEETLRFNIDVDLMLRAAFNADDSEILVAACFVQGERNEECQLEISRWDAESGDEIEAIEFYYPTAEIITFSPDGRWVVIASDQSSEAFVVDVKTAETVAQITTVRSNTAIAFDASSQQLALGSGDGSVSIYNVFSGDEVMRFQTARFGRMESLAFSADNESMAVGLETGDIQIYDLDDQRVTHEFSRHSAPVSGLAFVNGGKNVLTASFDASLLLWDLQHGAVLDRLGRGNEIDSITVSNDGTRVFAFTSEHDIVTYDSASGEELQRLHLDADIDYDSLRGPEEDLLTAVFSPDHSAVLAPQTEEAPHLIDLNTGDEISQLVGHEDLVTSAVFSPDGETIYTGDWEGHVIAWEAATGEIINTFEIQDIEPVPLVLSLDISADGQLLVAGTFDPDYIVVWDTQTGEMTNSFATQQRASDTITLSPDASIIATTGGGSSFTLWNMRTGAQILRFEGHAGDVTNILFSADGTQIVSGSDDETVLIWDITTGTPLRRLEDHTSAVTGIAFGPDEASLYSASWTDGIIHWRLDDIDELIHWTCENRAVIDLTAAERTAYGVTTTAPLCEVMGVGNGVDSVRWVTGSQLSSLLRAHLKSPSSGYRSRLAS